MFIALDIPAPVRAGIEAWGREALRDPALRPTPSRSLHITLCFLGSKPVSEVESLARVLREVADETPRIELRGPVARPPRGRPRLYALEVDSPETVSLQARLRDRLVAEGLCEPEQRPFWPHITVARVRSRKRGSQRPMRVGRPPGPLSDAVRRTDVRAVRIALYRSELKLQGAQYTPMAQVDLPGSGRQ